MGSEGRDASELSTCIREMGLVFLGNSGAEFLKGGRLWDPQIGNRILGEIKIVSEVFSV